jgi:D-alanine-D-alanine ligase
MIIAITYDLRDDYIARGWSEEQSAEFDSGETIDALEKALAASGHDAVRVGNVCDLAGRLVAGERWDLVFNVAEGAAGYAREAQVPALLEAYQIPYTFSDPLALTLTLHKGMAKRVVRDHGVATPDFAVVACEADVEALQLPWPLFAKPVAEGTGKGISAASILRSQEALGRVCRRLLREYRQAVLVERFLTGPEFTVGILGCGSEARPIGTMEIVFRETAEAGGYTYRNKKRYRECVDYVLVTGPAAERAEGVALASWRALGCRDAGRVDVRADGEGKIHFLEVNPLPGLHPEHSDLPILCGLLGVGHHELIAWILDEALARLGLTAGRVAQVC